MLGRFSHLVPGCLLAAAYLLFLRTPAHFLFPLIFAGVALGYIYAWLSSTFRATPVPHHIFFLLIVLYTVTTSITLALGATPVITYTLAGGVPLILIGTLEFVRGAKGDPRVRPAALIRTSFLAAAVALYMSAVVARGIPLFLQKWAGWTLVLFAVHAALLWYAVVRIHGLAPQRTLLFGTGFLLVVTELFWLSSLLPSGIHVSALPVAAGGMLYMHAARDVMLHAFEYRKFVRRSLVSILALAIIFSLSPWS